MKAIPPTIYSYSEQNLEEESDEELKAELQHLSTLAKKIGPLWKFTDNHQTNQAHSLNRSMQKIESSLPNIFVSDLAVPAIMAQKF